MNHTHMNRAVRWLPAALCAGVIFYASSRPGSTLPGGYSIQGHLGEYFVFGALLVWAFSPPRTLGRAVAIAAILASVYGMTDEFHQHFVAQRTPDVVDWGLDTVGALAGALTAAASMRLRTRRRHRAA